jgi:peptidyl-prolyl cis-trans isomerase SurA
MKNNWLFFVLCVFTFVGKVTAQDNVIDEVIWVIGDDAILRSDVEHTRLQMQVERTSFQGDPYCVIPERMAIQKLYLHQAKLDSIEVSDSHILQEVESRINSAINQVGSREKLEEYLGKPISAIRDEWRQNAKEGSMIREMQRKLVGNIKVTPADVRAFYNRIPQDSLPFIPTTVEVEIITREPIISMDEIDDVKRRLREYTERVTSGQNEFSSLARMYSEDTETAIRGGEMGFVGRASLVPEFAAVAFELNDPKRVSRIVETEYGFHIIQLVEKRGDRINVKHILLKPKVTEEELAAATAKLDSIRTDIVENKKFTFEEAVAGLSHDKDTRNNRGLLVNTGVTNSGIITYSERAGTARFEMEELPPEIGKAIYGMKVGEISKPFTMINSKQKEVVAVVRLRSRTEGHKASLSDDYQALKAMVEAEKQEAILKKWVENKIKGTYIRINDNWKNCDFQNAGWVATE